MADDQIRNVSLAQVWRLNKNCSRCRLDIEWPVTAEAIAFIGLMPQSSQIKLTIYYFLRSQKIGALENPPKLGEFG